MGISGLTSGHFLLIVHLVTRYFIKLFALTNNHTNWDAYWAKHHNQINLRVKFQITNDLDCVVAALTVTLTDAAKLATPAQPTSIPTKIRHAVRNTENPGTGWKSVLKAEFNASCKKTKDFIRRHSEDTFNHFISSFDPISVTNYSLWRVAKFRYKPPSYIPSLRSPIMGLSLSDQDRGDTLKNNL